jgi:hypothetical protein
MAKTKQPHLSAADKAALRRIMKKVRAIKIWKLAHK